MFTFRAFWSRCQCLTAENTYSHFEAAAKQTRKHLGKRDSTAVPDCHTHLSHHPIPDIVDFLAMFAIGYQVQVIGELDVLCDLFQNVDAEAFAAFFDVRPTGLC